MSEKRRKTDRTFCCVPQCNSKGSRNPDLSFHTFPSEKFKVVKRCDVTQRNFFVSKRDEWVRMLRTAKKITPRMRVCSKHFKEDDYNVHFPYPNSTTTLKRLKRQAVPSQNLPKWPSEIQKANLETSGKEKRRKISNSNSKVLQSKETEINPVEEEEICPISDERLYITPDILDSGNISYNSNEAVQIPHLEKDANVLPGIKEESSSDISLDDEEINLTGNESPEILKQKFGKLSDEEIILTGNESPEILKRKFGKLSDEEIILTGNESPEILKQKFGKLAERHRRLKIRFEKSEVQCKMYAKEIVSLRGIIDTLREIIKVSSDT